MKHLPNLLKQESSSAATLVHVLLRMYYDNRPEHQAARPQIAERLMPFVVSQRLLNPTHLTPLQAGTRCSTGLQQAKARYTSKKRTGMDACGC